MREGTNTRVRAMSGKSPERRPGRYDALIDTYDSGPLRAFGQLPVSLASYNEPSLFLPDLEPLASSSTKKPMPALEPIGVALLCAHCGGAADRDPKGRLLACSGCPRGKTLYCSAACQVGHWKAKGNDSHRVQCLRLHS